MKRLNKTSIQGTIDRFEGDFAVIILEDESKSGLKLPRSILPEGSKEGSIMEIKIKVKPNKTREAKKAVQGMIDKLQNP